MPKGCQLSPPLCIDTLERKNLLHMGCWEMNSNHSMCLHPRAVKKVITCPCTFFCATEQCKCLNLLLDLVLSLSSCFFALTIVGLTLRRLFFQVIITPDLDYICPIEGIIGRLEVKKQRDASVLLPLSY